MLLRSLLGALTDAPRDARPPRSQPRISGNCVFRREDKVRVDFGQCARIAPHNANQRRN